LGRRKPFVERLDEAGVAAGRGAVNVWGLMGRGWMLLLAGLFACEGPPPSATEAPSAVASAEVAPTATAAMPPPEKSTEAGQWKAQFQTQRGEVSVSEAVPYRPWVKDHGTAAAGKGELTVTIAPDGEVMGEGAGALGALSIRGRFEEGELRAGVTPADPELPEGMTGVLTAALVDDKLEGELRVSNPDGTIVRVAPVALERAK
jgi:hypothetical protein